jgi:hypothetical protein
VKDQKGHAAGKSGNRIADSLGVRAMMKRFLLKARNCLNVVFRRIGVRDREIASFPAHTPCAVLD